MPNAEAVLSAIVDRFMVDYEIYADSMAERSQDWTLSINYGVDMMEAVE